MTPIRLNLDALRGARSRREGAAEGQREPRGLRRSVRLEVSRRSLFGIAGAATVALSPTARAMETVALGRYRIKRRRRRVAFLLDGEERWVLDARRFGGRPRLTVDESGGRLCVELTGALLPGTDLPADLVCELTPGLVGTRMRLSLALGDFVATARFEAWLADLEEATGVLRQGARGAVARGARLAIAGRGAARFRPDWSLALSGRRAAKLEVRGIDLDTDQLEVALLPPEATSLLKRPARHRTLVSLERGGHSWDLPELLPRLPLGRLIANPQSFDVVHVETGRCLGGGDRSALVAESSALAYEPAPGLETPAGDPFRLPLTEACFALALEPSPASAPAALSARFAPETVWLATERASLEMADPSGAPGFELAGRGDTFETLCCEPALSGVITPLAGGSAGIMRPRAETRIAFLGAPSSTLMAQGSQVKPRVARPRPRSEEEQQRRVIQPREVEEATEEGRVEIAQDRLSRLRLPTNLTVSVIRPRDFLALDLEFFNLRLEPAGASRLVRSDPSQPATIVVHFPPQSLAEQAFYEVGAVKSGVDSQGQAVPAETGSERLPTPPVRSRLSGPSRLAFRVPREVTEIPYTLHDLLAACSAYRLAVHANARPPDPPRRSKLLQSALGLLGIRSRVKRAIPVEPSAAQRRPPTGSQPSTSAAAPSTRRGVRQVTAAPGAAVARFFGPPSEPAPNQTAIEMPYRLFLSPHAESAWAHSLDPVGDGEVYELWHTRLGVRADDGSVDEDDDHYRTVRAIWSPDFSAEPPPPPHANVPFRSTLDARDRHEVVALSSDYTISDWKPLPISVERMMLTSLGAWLASRGAWEPPGSLEVEEWKHRATMARDHYVRVVYKGYLYPFRHRASLIKVTERKFQAIQDGQQAGKIAAFLRQRMFIVVREPEVIYDYAVAPDGASRERKNPFKRVRITTLTTPDLRDPDESQIPGFGQQGFWPRTASGHFAFQLTAWDWRGVKSDFAAPLVFVGASRASKQSDLDKIRDGFAAGKGPDGAPLARRFFDGQKIAYAPSGSAAGADNTSLESDSLTFTSENYDAPAGEPGFFPALDEADVRIPAVDILSGGGQASRTEYSPVYTQHGFGGSENVSEIFLQIKGNAGTPLRFDSDRSGGVATPNLNIAGLSRLFGPVGGPFSSAPDLSELARGNFDPHQYFEGAGAKILGGIPLADIVSKQFGGGKNVPKMTTELIYPGGDQQKLPEASKAELLWEPEVVDDPTGTFAKKSSSKLRLHARITQRFDSMGQEPDVVVNGEIKNFDINLIPVVETFLVVSFKSFSFRSETGKKVEVDPQIEKVEFAGPLSFVNELKDYLATAGMNIDITPRGVEAGYSVGLPAITAGVMNLQNISLSAGLSIPFTGDPVRMRFGFCERENPFLLTVYCFGGGGFVSLAVGLDGVELLELALEFGANASLDIGVASGGVYIMAGIYIAVEGDECALTGYLRMGGALEILGIITLSLEFYMSLTYESKGNKVYGEATLTIEIEIAFISIPVEMSVRREFADPVLPKFQEMMSDGEWNEYCEAFAA